MNDSAVLNELLPEIDDLLEEVRSKNHVQVAVFRASEKHGKIVTSYEGSELAKSIALPPSLVRQDRLRMMLGHKPIYLPEVYKRIGGELLSVTANLRVNQGINFVAVQLAGTTESGFTPAVPGATGATAVAVADWIALSNNNLAVAAADAATGTLPWSSAQAADAAASGTTGEWTALGLARKAATMAHTTTVTSYTASATWTASATSTATSKAGLFGAAGKTAQSTGSTAVVFLANTFTATSLVTNDQLSLTWTVNI